MLRFQWDALRIGDDVLVHDDLEGGFELTDGVVKLVEVRAGAANDIGIRLNSNGKLLRPRRRAVHLLPLDGWFACWRCDTFAPRWAPAERDVAA